MIDASRHEMGRETVTGHQRKLRSIAQLDPRSGWAVESAIRKGKMWFRSRTGYGTPFSHSAGCWVTSGCRFAYLSLHVFLSPGCNAAAWSKLLRVWAPSPAAPPPPSSSERFCSGFKAHFYAGVHLELPHINSPTFGV